jgi:hypothetical protein
VVPTKHSCLNTQKCKVHENGGDEEGMIKKVKKLRVMPTHRGKTKYMRLHTIKKQLVIKDPKGIPQPETND